MPNCLLVTLVGTNLLGLSMWLKVLYICLIISSETLGQNSQVPNFQRKIPNENSLLKECYSGPIVWTNCRVPGSMKFPEVCKAMINQISIVYTVLMILILG